MFNTVCRESNNISKAKLTINFNENTFNTDKLMSALNFIWKASKDTGFELIITCEAARPLATRGKLYSGEVLIDLIDSHGKKPAEIADICGVSRAAVYQAASRHRAIMRAQQADLSEAA